MLLTYAVKDGRLAVNHAAGVNLPACMTSRSAS
jgi:hypothetical protein